MLRQFLGSTVGMMMSSMVCTQAVAEGDARRPARASEEVVVTGHREQKATEITEQAKQLVDVPGALGDPVAAVFSLPGVVYSSGEWSAPAIRGSSPDDNLFIVDSLPAGYVFHAFTNSVFSENIIQDFQLYPAAFGPQYGNATGAVFDISLRQPKNQPLRSVIDISMLRSGVFFEGGVTDNSAAYLSVRKSLIHLFMAEDDEDTGIRLKKAPQDEDYQFKYAWNLASDNILTLAANGASDLADADFETRSDVAQQDPDFAGAARVRNRFDNQSLLWDVRGPGESKLRLSVGHMRQDAITRWGASYFIDESLERSLVKLQYDQPIGSRHTLHVGDELSRNELGLAYDQILFVCNEFDPSCENARRGRIDDDQKIRDTSRTISAADTWRMTDHTTLDIGAQYQSNTYTGETFVNPRGTLAWKFSDRWVFNLKAGRYNRFPDLETVLPKIGNPELQSPRATHFAAGLNHELDRGWSWNAEVYYKDLTDLPLALDAGQPDAARLYSNEVRGRAYGVDLLVNKRRMDKWYGWLALSVAKSERTNERTGITRDYRLDTPLMLNAVMNYQFTRRFDAGLRFTLRSGQAETPIVGIQDNPDFPGYVQPVYGEPFSDRLPLYSRLDLRFKWQFLLKGHDSAVILDVINALNIRNVEGHTLDYIRSGAERKAYVVDDEGTGIFPALTFRFTF